MKYKKAGSINSFVRKYCAYVTSTGKVSFHDKLLLIFCKIYCLRVRAIVERLSTFEGVSEISGE
jgi:hypothetical protein